jgi:processive 1,2-diacylglycerol beta-glucosyltransferase
MVKLYDVDTNLACGELSDEQFQILVDALEEETSTDNDYYIHVDTIEMLENEGADPALLAILRKALGDREDMEIRWERS